jgi:hypothetical protein
MRGCQGQAFEIAFGLDSGKLGYRIISMGVAYPMMGYFVAALLAPARMRYVYIHFNPPGSLYVLSLRTGAVNRLYRICDGGQSGLELIQ